MKWLVYIAFIAISLAAPLVFPAYTQQFSALWVLIILAMTWDMQGGQMGYNSLGNIFFFGFGMYVSAVVQVSIAHDIGEYTYAGGINVFQFTDGQYFTGLVLGVAAAGILCALLAFPLGWILFGLRGPYFAIGTLGVAIAAGEMVGTWEWVGAGQGISMPPFPGNPDTAKFVLYIMNMITGMVCFAVIAWLYSTRFGLALNAIRDDEQKAEGMGLQTLWIKRVCWAVAAFFVGICGAIYGNTVGFIEPLEVAFQTIYLGIFMVVAVLLGGKGTLWGPVVGAIVFHTLKEVTWTHFLGWQWVALGVLIVVIVVYFQEGIMGWLQRQRPEWFGIRVESREPEAEAAT
ncbi:MAG: branched-chain amino acid ABC transporter permease [Paracoccaceae bacterium]|nr:branched-chain amino acid ABC transporter permease [Paracoccaceae bacterium]